MKMNTMGYAVLDARIAEFGADHVLMDIVTRISHGDNPLLIASNFGVPYIVLKGWLEENGSDMVSLAKRAHADVLAMKALEEVVGATVEDVSIARLRSDVYLKVAGKQDRIGWGDEKGIGGVGIKIMIDKTCGGTVKLSGGGVLRIGIGESEGDRMEVIDGEVI